MLLSLILLIVVFELLLYHPHFVLIESVFRFYRLESVIEVCEILKEGLRVFGLQHRLRRLLHLLPHQHPLVDVIFDEFLNANFGVHFLRLSH